MRRCCVDPPRLCLLQEPPSQTCSWPPVLPTRVVPPRRTPVESPSLSFLLWGLQRDQPDARTKDGDPKAQKPQTCCSVPSALAGPAGADTMGPSPGVMPGWEGAKDPGSPAEGSPAPPRGPTTTQDTWPGTAEDSKQPPRPASGTSCSEMQPLRPAFLWLLLRSAPGGTRLVPGTAQGQSSACPGLPSPERAQTHGARVLWTAVIIPSSVHTPQRKPPTRFVGRGMSQAGWLGAQAGPVHRARSHRSAPGSPFEAAQEELGSARPLGLRLETVRLWQEDPDVAGEAHSAPGPAHVQLLATQQGPTPPTTLERRQPG
ncbi:hypothetical protein J1605_022578 [Eschrichtius robustus]|uniref:Uncharacterized protein n=1 Tax=Eschrichtius robustus TaxID=9764 RepID=A0AB34HCD2_ESCRO|nr:hypothetical protein J1605_022578 [Eschrichtius robustus]